MYLWRRSATPQWWSKNQSRLGECAGSNLVIIERPNRTCLQIELASESRGQLRQLMHEFAGQIKKLPRDWLKPSARHEKTKRLKIGNALLISRSGALRSADYRKTAARKPPFLVIPAGAAFGTGEHATTAMSLRLLERVFCCWGAHQPSRADCGASPQSSATNSRSRGRDRRHAKRVRSPEFAVDLGTGSGILALAARLLGAKRVIGIDNDPVAISTAKQNARLNKVNNVDFRVADVRSCKFPRKIDIVTANLFSELLGVLLPKLKRTRWLILSGILRIEEHDALRVLKRQKMEIVDVRRRGKWVAILARGGT
jgi:ribosomal protein L11 methyltransferase